MNIKIKMSPLKGSLPESHSLVHNLHVQKFGDKCQTVLYLGSYL